MIVTLCSIATLYLICVFIFICRIGNTHISDTCSGKVIGRCLVNNKGNRKYVLFMAYPSSYNDCVLKCKDLGWDTKHAVRAYMTDKREYVSTCDPLQLRRE